LEARYGHDSFLVEVGEQTEVVRGFLASTFKETTRPKAAPKLGNGAGPVTSKSSRKEPMGRA
jgi:hypothetical protein